MSVNPTPAVKAALVDGLNAVPRLAGRVTWGTPRDGGGGREWIVVADVTGPQTPTGVRRPPGRREHDLTVLIVVSVASRDDVTTPRELAEPLFELSDAVETFVRENPDLGLNGVVWDAQVSRADLKEATGDGAQRSARVDVYVNCRARS